MVAADFDAYADTQHARRGPLARPPRLVAVERAEHGAMGWFSSDRTIREYAADIWGVPVPSDPPRHG